MKQSENLFEEDWEHLIVLDAARYDFLKKMFDQYISGNLEKVWSLGHNTPSWLRNTWEGYFEDIVYVSANPYVNSMGVDRGGFDATEHFGKVLDIWDCGSDNSLGIALPETVANATKTIADEYPDKRTITHFLQPHQPYLLEMENDSFETRFQSKTFKIVKKSKGVLGKISDKADDVFSYLGLEGERPVENFAKKYGDDVLKYAYKHNLERALGTVSELVEYLDGKVVITADHGEFLGEGGYYGHHYKSEHSIQREVPWIVAS